jgi:hypothetical protein
VVDGKWVVKLLEREVIGMWRGEITYVVRLLGCDVVTGMWRAQTTPQCGYWSVMLLLGCGGEKQHR